MIVEGDEEDEADDEGSRHDENQTENENIEEEEDEELHEVEVPASEFYEGHGQYNYDTDFIHSMDVAPIVQASESDGGSKTGQTSKTVYSVPQMAVVQDMAKWDVIATSRTKQKDIEPMRKYRLLKTGRSRLRPAISSEEKECLATWTKVGELEAWTLWDTGSTMTGITPAYGEIAKIKIDTLEDPHILQLGTVGSRSTIKYGADVEVQVANTTTTSYVDVANFDHYDMVIGTPWMRKNKVILDFIKNKITMNGVSITAIKVRKKDSDPRLHRHRATEKKTKDE